MAKSQYRDQAKALNEERLKLWEQAKGIVDRSESEKRAMRSDEKEGFDKLSDEMDALKERMDTLERMADGEEDEDRDDEDVEDEEGRDEEEEGDEEEDGERSQPRCVTVNGKRMLVVPNYRSKTVPGGKGVEFRQRPGESHGEYRNRTRRSTSEYNKVFFDYLHRGEGALNSSLARRSIQADSDIVGGYLVAPQEFTGKLIKFVNNLLFIRQLATVMTLKSAQSLGAPSLDTDPDDADWTSELDTGNEDNAMSFGKRELTPRPLAKRLKISNKLLRMAALSGGYSADNSVSGGGPEGLVRDRLAYKFAVSEEKAFMLGDGSNKPLGIFTASSRGISTARDVASGAAFGAGVVSADGLIAAKYNQKVQYWPKLQWVINRSVLKVIRQLKDAENRYLWAPGGAGIGGSNLGGVNSPGLGGSYDTLLDCPINMSEYAPNDTSADGNYIAVLGDFSFYWIADSEQLEIVRLNELYAAANLTGFIARMELDGMPVLEEAFTRVKIGA